MRGIPKLRLPASFSDFRWLGMLDHLCKAFGAMLYEAVKTTIQKPKSVRSHGYTKGVSVQECFALLFESRQARPKAEAQPKGRDVTKAEAKQNGCRSPWQNFAGRDAEGESKDRNHVGVLARR